MFSFFAPQEKILVCGGRDFADRALVEEILRPYQDFRRTAALMAGPPADWLLGPVLIHGAARGADSIAAQVADGWGWRIRAYPAEWGRYGRAAGAMRNQRMLDVERFGLVIVFLGGRGTADMIARAKRAGVAVQKIPSRKIFESRQISLFG
jgi:hypothetical protein